MRPKGGFFVKVIDAHVHLIQTVAGTGERGELRSLGKDGRAMYADGTVIDLIPRSSAGTASRRRPSCP